MELRQSRRGYRFCTTERITLVDKIAFFADHLPRKCEIALVPGLQPFVVGVRKACGDSELGHVSRPGLCQLMKLAQLALAIQEKLLFLL